MRRMIREDKNPGRLLIERVMMGEDADEVVGDVIDTEFENESPVAATGVTGTPLPDQLASAVDAVHAVRAEVDKQVDVEKGDEIKKKADGAISAIHDLAKATGATENAKRWNKYWESVGRYVRSHYSEAEYGDATPPDEVDLDENEFGPRHPRADPYPGEASEMIDPNANIFDKDEAEGEKSDDELLRGDLVEASGFGKSEVVAVSEDGKQVAIKTQKQGTVTVLRENVKLLDEITEPNTAPGVDDKTPQPIPDLPASDDVQSDEEEDVVDQGSATEVGTPIS